MEIYHCLVGSVALSGKHNIYCVNRAVGAAPGVVEMPSYDYDRKLNFGSVEFGQRQLEPLEQTRGKSTELVDVVTLAALEPAFNDGPLVLKIDVEGMELEVLEGAAAI